MTRARAAGVRKIWRFAWLAALCLVAGASTSPAQDAPNFFQKLFGLPAQRTAPAPAAAPAPAPSPHRTHRSDYVPSTTTRAPGAPGGAPVQATFHVEVIGDSLAVIAADGLTEAFQAKPEIGIVDKARDASGLVRMDYFDWTKFAASDAVAPDKPDFVVILLGINDGQPMRDGSDVIDTLSDKWKERYVPRIEALVAPYVAAHIPVAWVGLPPMRSDRANAQAVALNQLYRERSEKAGAKFIDIFDAFADQNGQYDAYGPAVDGQNVKLRGADGIHFTKAGARKLANFVEGEIRRAFEKRNPASDVATLPPDIEQAADDINAQIRREMSAGPAPSGTPEPAPSPEASGGGPAAPPAPPPRPLAGPILPLTAKPMSPGGVLATRESHPFAEPELVARVLRSGEPQPPVSGRADDFSWPKL
jgi:hypothetical protein